jgi:hypothetical protein
MVFADQLQKVKDKLTNMIDKPKKRTGKHFLIRKELLTRIPTPSCLYLIDIANEGRV